MNTDMIVEACRATLAGSASFPEVVSKLLAAGVEYYHVDYVGMRKSFYSADGDQVVTPINYEGLPSVASEFDVAGLRAAIFDSQRHGQKYREFTAGDGCGSARLFRLPARATSDLLGPQRRPAHRVVPGAEPPQP